VSGTHFLGVVGGPIRRNCVFERNHALSGCSRRERRRGRLLVEPRQCPGRDERLVLGVVERVMLDTVELDIGGYR